MLDTIAFSDESRVVLGTDKQWVWYRKGECNVSANVTSQKFPPGVMVFAVIGVGYKSKLLIVDGTIDSHKYIDNLVDLNVIPELDEKHGAFEWIFQRDGAPCHTSEISMEWLEENCDLIVDWPANSPDLSPIELLWAILKRIVYSFAPKTLAELKQVLAHAWDSIDQSTIDKLCTTFRARLQRCLERDGESISNDLHMIGEKAVWERFAATNRTRTEWTEEENRIIMEYYLRVGTKWSLIARLLPDRQPIQVKNHWYAVLAKRMEELRGDTARYLEMRRQSRDMAVIE
jgi:hypothetical protein